MLGVIQKQPPTVIEIDDDEKDNTEVNPKLLKVLKKLLQPNLKLHNDDYLNLLLDHLTKPERSNIPKHEVRQIKGLLLVWIKGALLQFEKAPIPPSANVLAFLLNIARYLSESEEIFVKLNSEDVFERLLKITKKISNHIVTVALMKLLTTFMGHKSGLQWLISTHHWTLLIDITLKNESIYVFREGYKFVAKLLEKTFVFNVAVCKSIAQHILLPLEESRQILSQDISRPIDYRRLDNSMHLVKEALSIVLTECSDERENKIMQIFLEDFHLEETIRSLKNLLIEENPKFTMYKGLLFLVMYNMRTKYAGIHTIEVIKVDGSINSLYNNCLFEAATEISVLSMLKLLVTCLEYWTLIKSTMPISITRDEKAVTFEDQMLMLQFMPIATIFNKIMGNKLYDVFDESDTIDTPKTHFRYLFFLKIMEKIFPKCVRLSYKWMDYLMDNFSINNGTIALKFLIQARRFYSKENGALAFQGLAYFLDDLIVVFKKKPEVQMIFLQDPDYLPLHLNALLIILEDYDLTWKDIIEVFFTVYLVFNLLDGFLWPTKVVVNALKLAEKSFSKYMTLQMALLIDDKDSLLITKFTSLLTVKLLDGAWEVRDSVIELIRALSVIVNTAKFSSYKQCLLNNNFPCTMVRMATDDGNAFVRASALKCLQEMVRDKEFCTNITQSSDIFNKILRILQMESEGGVRSEAASLVCSIFDNQVIPEEYMSSFLDIMSHVVIADLHWEVRVKALPFWKKIIDNSLTQQGMIDGVFPTITFSKQLKKIVTLNPPEVKKRLVTVLYELAQFGCLSVFYEALSDDCDLEVVKVATEIISSFVDLLKQYEVTEELLKQHKPPSISSEMLMEKTPVTIVTNTLDGGYCSNSECFSAGCSPGISESFSPAQFSDVYSPSQTEPFSDAVMEEILDTRDLNLLESVFNALDAPVMEKVPLKQRTFLSPQVFLNLVYSDLGKRLEDKTKCIKEIENFQSLLDDILKEYEPNNANDMDCY